MLIVASFNIPQIKLAGCVKVRLYPKPNNDPAMLPIAVRQEGSSGTEAPDEGHREPPVNHVTAKSRQRRGWLMPLNTVTPWSSMGSIAVLSTKLFTPFKYSYDKLS